MDRYLHRAASDVLVDLVNDGGGTYQAAILVPFKPEDGYAVAVGGVSVATSALTVELAAFLLKAVAGEYITPYVGTWLDGDVVCIDAVEYWRDFEYAMDKAREHGQKAIYSFTIKQSIEVTYE